LSRSQPKFAFVILHRTGTVYERGGVWWLVYFVRGRRVRESSGFTVKGDAENLLRQRVGDVAAGRRVGPEKATIGDLCALVQKETCPPGCPLGLSWALESSGRQPPERLGRCLQ